MEVRVLGCHGGETPKHKTSSFLLDGRVAFDAGAVTSMLDLEEQRAIETVLVSHAHLDHIKDLATLADNRTQQGGPGIRVAGLPSTLDVLRAHFFNDLIWPDFSKIGADAEWGPTIQYVPLELEAPTVLSGMEVVAVEVSHTIDTCAFVVRNGDKGSFAYSGDTGPTDRLWEVLSQREDLIGMLMEVSFPNHEHSLAKVSGHHTPETLGVDLAKLHDHAHLPILMYHIKPVFEQAVERELLAVGRGELELCRLGERYLF
jgi:cAMP phosphodiesterase